MTKIPNFRSYWRNFPVKVRQLNEFDFIKAPITVYVSGGFSTRRADWLFFSPSEES